MLQSTNHYTFTLNRPTTEVKEILLRNTLVKKNLVRVLTAKRFIGQIQDDNFKLIGSAALSVICTLNGRFSNITEQTTVIDIETKIHKPFLILWICFSVVIGLTSIGSYIMQHHSFSIIVFVPVLFAVLFFRLMLHIMYIRGRNISMRDFEKTIQ